MVGQNKERIIGWSFSPTSTGCYLTIIMCYVVSIVFRIQFPGVWAHIEFQKYVDFYHIFKKTEGKENTSHLAFRYKIKLELFI